MKPISEMNHEEIVTLSDDEVQDLIDYQCALDGVPIAKPEKLVCPTEPEAVEDLPVWEVDGKTFKDEAAAQSYSKFLNEIVQHTINTDYDYLDGGKFYREKPLGPYERDFVVSPKRIFSKDKWTQIEESVKTYQSDMKRYKKDKEIFDEMKENYDTVGDKIKGVIYRHNNQDELVTMHLKDFQRYLDLSDDNKEIAVNFFNNALTIEDEWVRQKIEEKYGIYGKLDKPSEETNDEDDE